MTWSLFSLILGIAYSASFASILSIPKFKDTIQTVDQLSERAASLRLIMKKGCTCGETLKTSKITLIENIAKHVEFIPLDQIPKAIEEKKRDTTVVFIGAHHVLLLLALKLPPKTFWFPPSLQDATLLPISVAIATAKKSPLKDSFNKV